MNVRQSVVVRKDLQMSEGLLAAQVAHINDMWLREKVLKVSEEGGSLELLECQKNWLSSPLLSVLAVNTPEELQVLIKKAQDMNVACHIWEDTIPSLIFGSEGKPYFLKVVVGASFGPDDDEIIKQITGGLPLY